MLCYISLFAMAAIFCSGIDWTVLGKLLQLEQIFTASGA